MGIDSSLKRLLTVQQHDTLYDQLEHRRRTLPVLVERAQVDKRRAEIAAAIAEITARRDEIAARQKSFETELASVEAKRDGLEQRLYSGTVTVARDLQAMESERDLLGRRAGSLEDEVLGAMTEREPLDATLTALSDEAGELATRSAAMAADAAQQQATIDEEIVVNRAARTAAVADIPDDLMARYEALRPRLDGIAVAALANGRCGGCHLELSSVELDEVRRRPDDEMGFCEACGRILVHP